MSALAPLPSTVPDDNVKTKKTTTTNHGAVSFLLFALSIGLGLFSYYRSMEAFKKIFAPFLNTSPSSSMSPITGELESTFTDNMDSAESMILASILMMVAAVIVLILSIAFAGAALATGQGSFGGLLVMGLVFSPISYLIWRILSVSSIVP